MTMTRAERQAESIKDFRVTEAWYERIAQYADDNSLSVSEAFREILTNYANGDVPPPARKRRSRRVSIWMPSSAWTKLRRRATKDGVTIADAIEAALEASL